MANQTIIIHKYKGQKRLELLLVLLVEMFLIYRSAYLIIYYVAIYFKLFFYLDIFWLYVWVFRWYSVLFEN